MRLLKCHNWRTLSPIMPIIFLLITCLAALQMPLLHAQDTQKATQDWRPLFDGKSLDGWVNVNCAPSTWTVREGMIHCTGIPTGALLP